MAEREIPVFSVRLVHEQDVVSARQRARQIADILGFDQQDQVKVATAVSEIARTAQRYGYEGRAEFLIRDGSTGALMVRISDRGPGIRDVESILSRSSRPRRGEAGSGRRLGEQRLDVLLELLGCGARRVAAHDVTAAIDQELGEVPLDGFRAEQPPLRLFQPFVQR